MTTMGKMNGAGSGSDDDQKQSYPGGAKASKNKVEKSGSDASAFPHGGSTHMITGTSAAPQQPGQSASQKSGGGKFAAGGSGHMFGDQKATPAPAGQSSHGTSGGDDKFSVKGGSTKMFGPQTAGPAKPA